MSYRICASICSTPVECLIDTGAAVSLLSVNAWQRVAGYCRVLPPIEKWTGQRLVGVNGSALSVKGVAGLPLSVEGNIFNVPFVVTDDILVGKRYLD